MFHTVQLSKADPTPLYIQLATELGKLIQSGLLTGGTKLPAIRFLSKQLAINRDTVVSAYKLLENQGLVEGYIGKGTYVVPSSPLPLSPSEESATPAHAYCSNWGFSKDLFPPSLCMSLTQEIIEKEGWSAFSDPYYRERHFLKQSAAHFLKNVGINPHFAQVRIIKSLDSFFLSLFKYSPKQGICVEDLRDLSTSCYLRSIGAKIHEVPLVADGMDLEVLEKHLRTGNIAYICLSSYLQNPTGLCYSSSNKQKIIELAKTYDCYIIEDGTFSEFIYDDTLLLPMYEHFSKERVIYLYHFSKLYLPYLSYSFAAFPVHMIKRLTDDTECTFNERLLRYYLDSNFLKVSRQTLFKSCKEKYELLYEGLSQYPDKLSISNHHGGLFLWIKSLQFSCVELCEYLTQNNIITSPGSLFTHATTNNYLRISISQLSLEATAQIINLLK